MLAPSGEYDTNIGGSVTVVADHGEGGRQQRAGANAFLQCRTASDPCVQHPGGILAAPHAGRSLREQRSRREAQGAGRPLRALWCGWTRRTCVGCSAQHWMRAPRPRCPSRAASYDSACVRRAFTYRASNSLTDVPSRAATTLARSSSSASRRRVTACFESVITCGAPVAVLIYAYAPVARGAAGSKGYWGRRSRAHRGGRPLNWTRFYAAGLPLHRRDPAPCFRLPYLTILVTYT